MKKARWTVIVSLWALLTASACLAADGVRIYDGEELAKRAELIVNGIKIQIFSNDIEDVAPLLVDIRQDGTETMESLSGKIDKRRRELFDGLEMRLKISKIREASTARGAASPRASGYVDLVESIYWWDNYNDPGNYWYACYDSRAMACFTHVKSGSYDIFDYNNLEDATWVYQDTIYEGISYAGTLYGDYSYKCYGGVATSGYNVANVVMYFYE